LKVDAIYLTKTQINKLLLDNTYDINKNLFRGDLYHDEFKQA